MRLSFPAVPGGGKEMVAAGARSWVHMGCCEGGSDQGERWEAVTWIAVIRRAEPLGTKATAVPQLGCKIRAGPIT
jgi:hypothetical protein